MTETSDGAASAADEERAEDPRVVQLQHPIQLSDRTEPITELRLRPMLAGHLRRLPVDGQTMGDFLKILGKLAGQPDAVIDRLSMVDMEAAVSIVAADVEAFPTSGGER